MFLTKINPTKIILICFMWKQGHSYLNIVSLFPQVIPTDIRRDQRLMFADCVTDIRESALKMQTFGLWSNIIGWDKIDEEGAFWCTGFVGFLDISCSGFIPHICGVKSERDIADFFCTNSNMIPEGWVLVILMARPWWLSLIVNTLTDLKRNQTFDHDPFLFLF